MNKWILMAGLATACAGPLLLSPSAASASCYDRKVTGTVVGGLGGALVGNAISRGGGGAVVGGLGGAVLGNQVGRGSCGHDTRGYRSSGYGYRSHPRYYRGSPDRRYAYDRQSGVAPDGRDGAYANNCRTETRSYYDDRGSLVQRPVQICGR